MCMLSSCSQSPQLPCYDCCKDGVSTGRHMLQRHEYEIPLPGSPGIVRNCSKFHVWNVKFDDVPHLCTATGKPQTPSLLADDGR